MRLYGVSNRSRWIVALATAALLGSCASPTSDVGVTGGQGGSSGATGSGGAAGRGASASGGATGGSSAGTGGATGGSSASGGGGSAGGRGGSGAGGSTPAGGSTGRGGSGGASGAHGGSGGAGASGTGGHVATGGSPGTGGNAGAGGASAACAPGAPWTGGQQYTANSVGNAGNGYSYQLWFNGGSGSMTVAGADAKFSATWNNPTDFLARVGLTWSSTQTFDQLGTVSANFAHTKTGSAGYSFVGIYGWSVEPIVEYYIVEDWFGSPPTADGGTKMGTFTLDGGTYDVYQHTQINQPSVTGANATFPQFYSIRQTARQCGHISISEHYKQWAALGLTLGKMEEAKIIVETGGGGAGSITFTTATVTVN